VRKKAKRILRKQQRKETAIEKQNFLRNLENNPDQKTFFKLLRRNQATATSKGPEVLFKGTKSANTCDEQRELFAEHFQELATPQNAPDYSELLNNCERRCQLVRQTSQLIPKSPIKVTQQEKRHAVKQLNGGKSADEYGVMAEHFKLAGNEILQILQLIFNRIFEEGKIPKSYKTGTITPIAKKGKDPSHTDSYRRITVTSIQGKIFEYVLLAKLNLRSDNQSEMQFGFTPGLSPNMAALVVSEVCAETSSREPLFITTLDSQKAFDIVNHKFY
jgi:hypothetical protein